MAKSQVSLSSFLTIGDLLKFLRRRAQITQRELSVRVGYSEAQISRIETNQRLPDIMALKALFIPALGIDNEPEVISHLLNLATIDLRQELIPDLSQTESLRLSTHTKNNNLPPPFTSFIGREKEIRDILHLLKNHRLVTIHGSGGVGKTRLCLEVTAQALASYPNGVWFVELAPLVDTEMVPQLVATTIGLYDTHNRPAIELITDYLSDKRLLLFLDNCEHLIDACAHLANQLLQVCPKLSIITSSREALRVVGEMTYRVPSLTFPETKSIELLENMGQYEAVQLFIERAAVILPEFHPTEANAPYIIQICQQLDGIPLAIELAAARIDLLSVEQMAVKMKNLFQLLTGGSRTVLPRQQTLRASIDWSYRLLTQAERLLLQRLSIFTGSWNLEAAETICGFKGLPVHEVLDELGKLVKKSLVVPDHHNEREVRYRILETIRQYAREKLLDTGEGKIVRDRHLNYYLQLADQAEPNLRGPEQVVWNDRLEVEIDNFRSALEWSFESQIEKGLQIVGRLKWFWHERGYYYRSEIIDWLERALTLNPPGPDQTIQQVEIWAKALAVQAFLSITLGKTSEKVLSLFEQSRSLYKIMGPAGQNGLVFLYFFWAYYLLVKGGDRTQFQPLLEEALSIAEAVNDKFGIAEVLPWIERSENLSEKIQNALRGLALRREIGDYEGIWWDLLNLARLYYAKGDSLKALQINQEAIEVCQQVKNRKGLALIEYYQGLFYAENGCFKEATSHLKQSVQRTLDIGDRYFAVMCEIGLANVLQRQENEASAQSLYHKLLDTSHKEGFANEQAIILSSLGEIAWAQNNLIDAEEKYREAIRIAKAAKLDSSALGLYGLGKVAFACGDRSSAWAYHSQALQTWKAFNTNDHVAYVLEAMAVIVATPVDGVPITRENALFAAHLHGTSQAFGIFTRLNFVTRSYIQPYDVETCLHSAKVLLGAEAYAQAFTEGKSMSVEQAISYALGFAGI